MYVILVENDNSMQTTQKERIMQRSKLVDELWFLVPPDYKGYDMSTFTVLLEYVLPVSRKYCSEILVRSEDGYQGRLKYLLPIDTNLTSEAGSIEISLSFILSELDEKGKSIQRVRKISSTTIDIIPATAWSDVVPDGALGALDQRIIKTDAQIKALEEMNNLIADTKADNIKYNNETNELQLTSNGNVIGDKVVISTHGEDYEDGVPVIDINNINDSDIDNAEQDNVIEF